MSVRLRLGPDDKDLVIFATKEDHSVPSTVTLPEPEPAPGLILPNGHINWNCPCLGGMATGPCGVPFREAFSCFHYSEADPKGSDCYDAFSVMQECMAKYPTLYNKDGSNDDDDGMKFDSLDDGDKQNKKPNQTIKEPTKPETSTSGGDSETKDKS